MLLGINFERVKYYTAVTLLLYCIITRGRKLPKSGGGGSMVALHTRRSCSVPWNVTEVAVISSIIHHSLIGVQQHFSVITQKTTVAVTKLRLMLEIAAQSLKGWLNGPQN